MGGGRQNLLGDSDDLRVWANKKPTVHRENESAKNC